MLLQPPNTWKPHVFTTASVSALSLLMLPMILRAQACRNARSVTSAELQRKSCGFREPTYFPACERLSTEPSPLIFSALVESIAAKEGELMLDGHCIKTSLQMVTLRRLEMFRGEAPERITLQAGDLNGFYFSAHRRYLVFAFPLADGQLAVDGYGQTRDLRAAAEDVAYLRTFASRSTSGQVFGYASRAVAKLDEKHMGIPREKPLAGTTISLAGPAERQAKVDAAGRYRFQDVPPGDYTIEIYSGPDIVWGSKRKITVPPKGCAKVDFQELPFNPDIAQRSLLPDDLCPARPH